MRRSLAILVLVYLSVATVEVVFHWRVGLGATSVDRLLRRTYFQRDADNHKAYVAGLVDFIIPAVTLGIACGFATRAWSTQNVQIAAILLSVGVVALYPVGDQLVRENLAAGEIADSIRSVSDFQIATIKALCVCGMSAYFARKGRK